MHKHDVYLGVGSNLDNPVRQVQSAFMALNSHPDIDLIITSSLYKTKPLGPKQPDFINAVAQIKTALPPQDLLQALQSIEAQQNRVRDIHWGPRTIDLDILLYDQAIIDTKTLTVPHLGLLDRSFVIVPLLEINPEVIIPPNIHLNTYAKKYHIDCDLKRIDPCQKTIGNS